MTNSKSERVFSEFPNPGPKAIELDSLSKFLNRSVSLKLAVIASRTCDEIIFCIRGSVTTVTRPEPVLTAELVVIVAEPEKPLEPAMINE